MKVGVRIMPRNEVLDTQGRAVQQILKQHDHGVNHCRVGRYVELELGDMDREAALTKAKEIASFVLHNPLIETFELEEL